MHKGDDKRLINNYRPISILPVSSKVLEKLMHFRLTSFFIDMCNLICDNQYGFRAKHTTYMALLNIMDEISVEIDNRKYYIGIFLDLYKAFDTVDHNILLKKLEIYGIRGTALNGFLVICQVELNLFLLVMLAQTPRILSVVYRKVQFLDHSCL